MNIYTYRCTFIIKLIITACARDRFTLTEAGLSLTLECMTGAYDTKQMKSGLAFCVDKDGVRSGPLVSMIK